VAKLERLSDQGRLEALEKIRITGNFQFKSDKEKLGYLANEISINVKILNKHLIKIGELLTIAKEIAGHGNFQDWVKDDCDFSHETANNFMNVYKHCYGFPEIVERLRSSVLYTISAPKFPVEIRQLILEKLIAPKSLKELTILVDRYNKEEIEIDPSHLVTISKIRNNDTFIKEHIELIYQFINECKRYKIKFNELGTLKKYFAKSDVQINEDLNPIETLSSCISTMENLKDRLNTFRNEVTDSLSKELTIISPQAVTDMAIQESQPPGGVPKRIPILIEHKPRLETVVQSTPVETYQVGGVPVYVKREDMACLPPGPPFAKVRGLQEVLLKLRGEGIRRVAYVDTPTSMAGWGVAYFAYLGGIEAVIFEPQFTEGVLKDMTPHLVERCREFGAEVRFYHASLYKVVWNSLRKENPDLHFLPLGLRFPETVGLVAKEFATVDPKFYEGGSIVLCVSSGTMAAGVLAGLLQRENSHLSETKIFGVTTDKVSFEKKTRSIWERAQNVLGFSPQHQDTFKLIIPGYRYRDREEFPAPFPCNPW
jgi:1-aminocyclopropane-1-carboxylate deaminase/D-cysteine desulfhydrase-like pyridoxal-dependent ACC family enzyme